MELGVRHIDTAAAYFNEAEVGQAVKDSGIRRDEVWITSKLWLQDYKYAEAQKGIDISLKKLGTDYMDMYLLHQPYGEVTEAWGALEDAKKAGKIRSIGVSNMTPKLWQQYVPQFSTMPAVNQVEFNPFFQQKKLRELLAPHDVKIEAWAPLGQGNSSLLTHPEIVKLAAKYGKDAGQVILRFEYQEGIITFPKSVHEARIKSNKEIFDFALTEAEMDALRALDTNQGIHDPDRPGVKEILLGAFDVHAND